jgi:WD40 repeat protein
VDRSTGRGHVVTGDDAGDVRLLNYPCVAKGARCARFRGHSSHVSAVRFSADDAWVASAGSVDKSLLVWRVTEGDSERTHSVEMKNVFKM